MKEPHEVIRRIRLTEKATVLGDKLNQYVFEVHPRANKLEIRRAVETIFQKKVVRVNTMNVLGKPKRSRRGAPGKKPDWKKAIVTLKEGEKISLA